MIKQEFLDFVASYEKNPGEYTEQEIYEICVRFCEEVPLGERSWDELQGVLGTIGRNGLPRKGEALRTYFKKLRYDKGEVVHNEKMLSGQTIDGLTFPEFEEKTEELKRDLYKQQVKTRDHMNEYRALIRKDARIDMMKDLIKESVSTLPKLDFEKEVSYDSNPEVEGVLLLSDFHIGDQVDNFYNKYNIEIARRRVNEVVCKTIEYCQNLGVTRLNVLNLGDLIENDLHVTGRIIQEVDAVQQTMIAAEVLSEALVQLAEAIPDVVYRSCLDNHSRYIMDYKAAKDEESLVKLIDWYLQERLKNTDIEFAADELDRHIGLFTLINGDKFVFAHGHEVSVNLCIQTYTAATHSYIKYVAVGHWHSTKMKTFLNSKVFENGSLKGLDNFAEKHGLFGEPEQTLLIFEGSNLVNITINLKDIK